MKKWFMFVLAAFMLAACSDKEENLSPEEAAKVIEEGTVGFEVMGDQIVEADNIPGKEKEAILAAFDEYIAAFNSKDLERYVNTLSKNPIGFDYDEDIEYTKKHFEQYDIKREVSDVFIVKYSENQAQVRANILTEMKDLSTNAEASHSGAQVTVFVKEDGLWKVTRLAYVGDGTDN